MTFIDLASLAYGRYEVLSPKKANSGPLCNCWGLEILVGVRVRVAVIAITELLCISILFYWKVKYVEYVGEWDQNNRKIWFHIIVHAFVLGGLH